MDENHEWVIQIKNILKNEAVNDLNNPICIFQIPSSLSQTKPETYTPQVMGFGPYHHLRSKPYQMEKCKIDFALKAQETLQLIDFEELLGALKEKVVAIRACYEWENLNMSDEDTLLCVVAVDVLFLLEFLYEQAEAGRSNNNDPPKFIDAAGREHSEEEILRDIVMLENQIPTIVLNVLLTRFQVTYTCNLIKLCSRLSPIKLEGNSSPREVKKNFHLLDALYLLIWLGKKKKPLPVDKSLGPIKIELKAPSDGEIWGAFWSHLKLNVVLFGVFAVVVDLIVNVLKVLGISISLDFPEEKFLIPSASKLQRVGVKFLPIDVGGIKDIKFDNIRLTLKLPVLTYDAKLTEVVIRNLLANEALATPESPKFASFIELMSSLIVSIEDVEVFKAAKVLPSDVKAKELVKLLDELVSSDPTKALSNHEPKVIKVAIEGVNKYYYDTKKVRTQRIINKYLYVSWKVLTVLALVLLLLLVALQAFCSVYSCPRLFHSK